MYLKLFLLDSVKNSSWKSLLLKCWNKPNKLLEIASIFRTIQIFCSNSCSPSSFKLLGQLSFRVLMVGTIVNEFKLYNNGSWLRCWKPRTIVMQSERNLFQITNIGILVTRNTLERVSIIVVRVSIIVVRISAWTKLTTNLKITKGTNSGLEIWNSRKHVLFVFSVCVSKK